MVNIYVGRLTASTYVLVIAPPGEAEFNCLKINVQIAKEDFVKLDLTGELPGKDRGGAVATAEVDDGGADGGGVEGEEQQDEMEEREEMEEAEEVEEAGE
jgi:hypothetical protein